MHDGVDTRLHHPVSGVRVAKVDLDRLDTNDTGMAVVTQVGHDDRNTAVDQRPHDMGTDESDATSDEYSAVGHGDQARLLEVCCQRIPGGIASGFTLLRFLSTMPNNELNNVSLSR